VVLAAPRPWQFESLYRANQKYRPSWRPRLLAYERGARLLEILVAVGQAEGFLPNLSVIELLRRLTGAGSAREHAQHRDSVFVENVKMLSKNQPHQQIVEPTRGPAQRHRLSVLSQLRNHGIDPYPVGSNWGEPIGPMRSRYSHLSTGEISTETITVAGRIIAQRLHGGLIFADLCDHSGKIQLLLSKQILSDKQPKQNFSTWRHWVRPGDLICITGKLTLSNTGELSMIVEQWKFAAKSINWSASLNNPDAAQKFTKSNIVSAVTTRAVTLQALRSVLDNAGYIEAETPILQPIHGGAQARPFATQSNATGIDLYLRIAPEFALKRLLVGGLPKVYEIGRNFRNEGVDATHNPEFTSLEAYQAGGDYRYMGQLAQQLVLATADAIHGRPQALRPDGSFHDLTEPWKWIPVYTAVSNAVGQEISPDTTVETLQHIVAKLGLREKHSASAGSLVALLYDKLVEPRTSSPTFYYDFPIDVSPLTRQHRTDPRLAERWDLVAWGLELGTAYSELTDPIDQRARLTLQSLAAAAGDEEAMELDEDFLNAMEQGCPPAGGLGLGVDRLIMTLTGQPINQVLAFSFRG
jgi:lysyl-tRNA synthetase class 2